MMEFEHDFNLYSSDLDYARSQESAGMQNIFGAADTLGATLTSFGTGMNTGANETKSYLKMLQDGKISESQFNSLINS